LVTFFKKWWVRATPDYHYLDFAKAVPNDNRGLTGSFAEATIKKMNI
jgi:hypothetical protein